MKPSKFLPYLIFFLIDIISYYLLSSSNNTLFEKSFSLQSSSSMSNIYLNRILILIDVFSYMFLIITKTNSGEIEINSKGILERQISLSDPDIKLSYSPLMIMRLMPSNGCKECKIYELPLRSYHCQKCNRCIRTFDHHCYITNCCIGEDNHFIFCLFLLSRIASFILSSIGLLRLNNFMIKKIFIILYFFILGLFETVLVIYFVFHMYLIMTNQTTYELFNPQNCPYLRIFKQERLRVYKERGIDIHDNFSFRPFDSGIKKNFEYALFKVFHNKEKMKWEDVYFNNLKTNHVEINLCEDNKYLPGI